MPEPGAPGFRRTNRDDAPLPEIVVAFDPVGEITVTDNRAASLAAAADAFAERFGLEDVESASERYALVYAEPPHDVQGRRRVTITGRGAERSVPRTVHNARRDRDARRPPRRRHERAGVAADRAALWAVALCVLLVLVAAASAHAAVFA